MSKIFDEALLIVYDCNTSASSTEFNSTGFSHPPEAGAGETIVVNSV
jgi:hypothetical protein